MKPSILRPLALAAMLSLSACQAYPTTPLSTVSARQGGVLLQGRVAFPGYGVLAAEGDLTRQSAIALIDADGITCAAGTTDAAGGFTLYRSTDTFTPQTGDVFTLEAMRRQDVGTEHRWLTLRTLVRRTPGGWTSLSGPSVTVSLTTTTLCALVTNTPSLLSAAWGSVSGTTASALPGYPLSDIQAMTAVLTEQLAAGNDPSPGLIYEGDYTIDSQASADALKPYSRIRGSLTIEGDAITTFSAPFLRQVDDYVSISSPSLTSLSGLSSLVSCGSFELDDSDALTDLSGLGRLASTGEFNIQNCDNLTSLAGLSALAGTASLVVRYCPALTTLAGLEGLTALDAMTVEYNDGLTSLSALDAVVTAGEVHVYGNPALTDMGLGALTTAEALTIENNDALASLSGLDALTTVNGNLNVKSNDALASLDGLGALTTVGGAIDIGFSPTLASLDALGNLTSVGSLYLAELPLLTDTAAFGGLTTLSTLTVYHCPGLTDLAGFTSLTTLGELTISDAALCGVTLPTGAVPGTVNDGAACGQ